MDTVEVLVSSPQASDLVADLQGALPAAARPEVRELSTRGVEQVVVLTFLAEALKVTGSAIGLVPAIREWRRRMTAQAQPFRIVFQRGTRRVTIEGNDPEQVQVMLDRVAELLR